MKWTCKEEWWGNVFHCRHRYNYAIVGPYEKGGEIWTVFCDGLVVAQGLVDGYGIYNHSIAKGYAEHFLKQWA